MSANDITALRAVLFDTLRGIRDGSVDIEKAKAINDTAQVIVNTAKAEIDFARATGATVASNFIPSQPATDPRAGIKTIPAQPKPALAAKF